MLAGLRIARALGAQKIVLKNDSQLIIGQVRGDFEAKETRMQKYLKLVNQLVSTFLHAEFIQIPQDRNTEADKIARSASAHSPGDMHDWKLEEQNSPSITEFQTFPYRIARDGRTQYCHFFEMDDYPQTLKKPGKSRSVLLGLRY